MDDIDVLVPRFSLDLTLYWSTQNTDNVTDISGPVNIMLTVLHCTFKQSSMHTDFPFKGNLSLSYFIFQNQTALQNK